MRVCAECVCVVLVGVCGGNQEYRSVLRHFKNIYFSIGHKKGIRLFL